VTKILAVTQKQESPQTVSLELRESVANLLVGYVEITLVPNGARIEAWNADDSPVEGGGVVQAERPS